MPILFSIIISIFSHTNNVRFFALFTQFVLFAFCFLKSYIVV